MSLVLFDPPSWKSLLKLSFWFGVFFAAMGSVITFAPGGEVPLAACIAVFVSPGLLLSRNYRIASIVLLVLLALYAWGGYQHGIAYQQRLRERQQQDRLEGLDENPNAGWAPPTVGS